MIELFLAGIILGIAAAYPLNALILERKMSHEGPFKSKNRTVTFLMETGEDGITLGIHKQRVCLWDWIRRIDGVYDVKGDEWYVNAWRAERWTCPFCLSFWISFFFSLPYCALYGQWLWFPALHLLIAVIARWIKRLAYES